jgi:hypothetical protein
MQRFGGLAYQYKRACSDQGNVFLRLQFVQAAIVRLTRNLAQEWSPVERLYGGQ